MATKDNTVQIGLAIEAEQAKAAPSAVPQTAVRANGFFARLLGEAARVSSRTPLWIALTGKLMDRFDVGSYNLRLHFHAFPKKGYAYGLYQGALLAQRLGHKRITAVEFGVAGGNGLVALEFLAEKIEKEVGVGVDVVGFDSGEGLPSTDEQDYRDLPYFW